MKTLEKFVWWGVILLLFTIGIVGFYSGTSYSAGTSRSNLQTYSRNIEILSDKTGNLDTLIGELQSYTVYNETGSVLGTTVPVPGILPTDSISRVVVQSSAALLCGATVLGGAGDGQIAINSKIWGPVATKINFQFVGASQTAGINLSTTTGLASYSTGYAFTVYINTGNAFGVGLASANSIVDLLNGNAWTSKLVRAATVTASNSFSSATFFVEDGTRYKNQKLLSGLNSVAFSGISSNTLTQGQYEISPAFVTITSSGNVNISTGAPVTSTDGLELHTIGYR